MHPPIANVVLDRRTKSGEAGILCKLDIQKAFDHLSQSYFISMLRKIFDQQVFSGVFVCSKETWQGREQWNSISILYLLYSNDTLIFVVQKHSKCNT
ncbi:hypothetical protein H5410_004326 [Solanum commersonii]|uniref:Reverse transcriptase domain-containing protein n=1 Tax=Solanum commersonii TaxID=4109 RepID=A0A9J6B7G1_SOLCO|nr:hypothetical protein H5410_004326 [Solanum commersonii]